ncbi:MAG: peptidoglycan DD-metalloendopeptidase family protein [Burkholderiales bacterium]|nr:peptidoglycan DD-metalloendopeptidase family protein [Burkholderiales bacterium]
MNRVSILSCCAAFAAVTFAGCANRPVQAPVLDRAPPAGTQAQSLPPATSSQDLYTVRRGDTMFSIALDHGLDYKELAAWNNVGDPGRIRPGQQLRIKPPAGAGEAPVTVRPVVGSGRVETRPLGSRPVTGGESTAGAESEKIKSGPLARKLPYTPENLALLQRGEARGTPAPASAPAAAPAAPVAAPKPEPADKPAAAGDEEDKVDWGWPAQGKVVAGFSEASNKGLDIAGKMGDPVIASAPGRVVYSGSGLRGYGKLVIIKHNKTYLSAYAHNKDILVKEGQSVVKGQKIAEVGNTDSDKPKLHFEIRKLGKPVDPAKYLPPT